MQMTAFSTLISKYHRRLGIHDNILCIYTAAPLKSLSITELKDVYGYRILLAL